MKNGVYTLKNKLFVYRYVIIHIWVLSLGLRREGP